MKRCARCGNSYGDEYDGCPNCASASRRRKRIAAFAFAGVAIVMAVVTFAKLSWDAKQERRLFEVEQLLPSRGTCEENCRQIADLELSYSLAICPSGGSYSADVEPSDDGWAGAVTGVSCSYHGEWIPGQGWTSFGEDAEAMAAAGIQPGDYFDQ